MTTPPARSPERVEALLTVVDAAQRAGGILAARHRRDQVAVTALMSGMDDRTLASGSLLLAELAINLYANETRQDQAHCISDLCLQLENAVRTP